MTDRNGSPIWYELVTPEPGVAEAYYAAVMGWTFSTHSMSEDIYRVATTSAGKGAAGVMTAPEGADAAPGWSVYFAASDVDAMCARVEELGGRILMPPQTIPGVGRFAQVADPQGAMFYLMRGESAADSTAFEQMTPGHCCWNELLTSDQKAALDFYGALFGWTRTGAMPMPGMGDYTFIGRDDTDMFGAMMDAPRPGTLPVWNFAFSVPDIDVASAAVQSGGGILREGPMELPGEQGDWMIQTTDPQGAMVMFVGKRSAAAAS